MKYDILQFETLAELKSAMEIKIAEGWVPLGGIQYNNSAWYFQAIVKLGT